MSKLKNSFLAAIALMLVATSCKKDDSTPQTTGGPTLPSNAKGAFYATKFDALIDFGGGSVDTTTNNLCYAWFETYTPATKDAGTVKLNGQTLVLSENIFGSTVNYPMYSVPTSGTVPDLSASASLAWSVSGNTTTGVPAITYTDNTPFIKVTSFVTPATTSINSNLTLNFAFANFDASAGDQVIFSLIGSKGNKARLLTSGTTSVTVTSAEIKEVAVVGDELGVEIVAIKINQQTFSSKLYAFVKEYALEKFVTLSN